MGLFGDSQERASARASARAGIAAQALITQMRATGETRAGDVAREYEFRLVLTPAGSSEALEVVVRQFMNRLALAGLAPGEQALVMYDAGDPTALVIFGSPRYQVVEPGVVVPVADVGEHGA